MNLTPGLCNLVFPPSLLAVTFRTSPSSNYLVLLAMLVFAAEPHTLSCTCSKVQLSSGLYQVALLSFRPESPGFPQVPLHF